MAKKTPNKNFRLGLDRSQLIQAAQMFGKSEKTAKKDSTKRLEEYLTRRLSGDKKAKVPTFNERQVSNIQQNAKDFGFLDAVHSAAYHIRKATGSQDENNFLRLTIARNFAPFYNGTVTNDILDELVNEVEGSGSKNEIISGIIKNDFYYTALFSEYADKLEQKVAEQNAIAEQEAQQQFNNQSHTKTNNSSKKKKSKR